MIPIDELQAKVIETIRIFPWYKELIRIHSANLIESLEQLPLMTTTLLKAYYYHQPEDPSLNVYLTSGTNSGRRKAILYSEEDENHYIQIKAQLFNELIRGSGCIKAVADMGTGHAANTSLNIFKQLGLEGHSISFELPIQQHINQLQTIQPDLLYTMPSILDHIINETKTPRMFGIRKIILVGEIAPLKWQSNIARIFGLHRHDIIDTYGSIEIGTIAYYSHNLNRYILIDGMLAEGIETSELNEGLEPLGENEKILVLTSLTRKLLPAIRFVTYDVVRDFRPVLVNGVIKMSFQAIVKRVGRELKHGEKISLYDIEQAVYQHVEDAIIRVRVQNNVLNVQIKSKSNITSALSAIRQEIRECIPEIGMMIRNGLLDDIQVIAAKEDQLMESGQIKNKKIY